MKTKLITTLLICFFVNLFTAQTLVKPADIKMSSIADFLKKKGYTILDQKDTYLKIQDKEKVVLYLDIDEQGKKYIDMNVNILLKKDISKDKIKALLAQINDLAMIKADYMEDQNSIKFQYFFWITNGFTYETLEDAITEFFLYQGDSYQLDKEKIFSYE
jgi:hypothetical protein